MSRLIDADELIEKIEEYCDELYEMSVCDYLNLICKAPTVSTNGWHYPSKGELPDDNEIVLLSIKGRVWKRMEFGQWNGQFFVANDSDYSVSEIIAWMPLPEPPKEEA